MGRTNSRLPVEVGGGRARLGWRAWVSSGPWRRSRASVRRMRWRVSDRVGEVAGVRGRHRSGGAGAGIAVAASGGGGGGGNPSGRRTGRDVRRAWTK
jgi:hypothetical protein